MGRLDKFLLIDLFKGLGLTLKYTLKKPVTFQYPEQRRPIEPRYRGRHRLVTNDDGSVRCVACGLCAAICPARCIYLEPGETAQGVRHPQVYEIEVGRCIYCGFCAEVCPVEAIVLTQEFELATTDKPTLRYDKAALVDKPRG